MKRTLLLISAAVLLTASCSEDNSIRQQPAGDGNVTFTVQLPAHGLGSRAFADGKTANDLVYAVYDNEGNFILQDNTTFAAGELQTTVSLSLANGKAYRIAFFAHNAQSRVYKFNAEEKTLDVDYSMMSDYNTVDHDAFYKLHETGLVSGPVNQSVELTRPLAQINWGTDDLDCEAVISAYGEKAASLRTEVYYYGAYSTMNILTGECSGEIEEIAFERNSVPTEEFPVKDAEGNSVYKYVSANYVLAPTDQSQLLDVYLVYYKGDDPNSLGEVEVLNLPIQGNYRTNIYGSLLTNPVDLTVKKDVNFNGDYSQFTFTTIDGKEYIEASTSSELAAAIGCHFPVYVAEDKTIDAASMPAINTSENVEMLIDGAIENIGSTLTFTQGLSLSGKGSINFESDYAKTAVRITGGDITIKDVSINAPNASKGIVIGEMSANGNIGDIVIENLNINTSRSGIEIDSNAKSCSIRNCVVKSSDRLYGVWFNFSPDKNNQWMTPVVDDCVFIGPLPAMLAKGNSIFNNCKFIQSQFIADPNLAGGPVAIDTNVNAEFNNCYFYAADGCNGFFIAGSTSNSGYVMKLNDCKTNRNSYASWGNGAMAATGITFDNREETVTLDGTSYVFNYEASGSIEK